MSKEVLVFAHDKVYCREVEDEDYYSLFPRNPYKEHLATDEDFKRILGDDWKDKLDQSVDDVEISPEEKLEQILLDVSEYNEPNLTSKERKEKIKKILEKIKEEENE